MAQKNWDNLTDKRFVAFFDILGFKDMVQRFNHEAVLEKLEVLKSQLSSWQDRVHGLGSVKELGIEKDQTSTVTFSDSVIIFSKGDTTNDAVKILIDAYLVLRSALINGIAIKGAMSYGKITVNVEKSIFFGQPIIDAYLLHEELQLLSVVLDHNIETRFRGIKSDIAETFFSEILTSYKVPLKSGKVTHSVFKPQKKNTINDYIEHVKKQYQNVSGRPRLYLDNTLDFLNSLTDVSTPNTQNEKMDPK